MFRHPNRLPPSAIYGFLLLYGTLWVFIPTFLNGSYPLDVTEGLYWGREWQWGYYKHPPLSSWILHLFHLAFGKAGPYLLSQLSIGLTLWLIYRLGRKILPPQTALAGTLLTMGIVYYSWPSPEFNHNIAQLPVWIGLIYTLYLATTANRLRDWLLFGLLAGLGMLVKYTVAILLAAALLYTLTGTRRRLWRSAGPWLAVVLAGLVFLPNLIWLADNNWLPFVYAQARSAEADGRWSVFGFLATQAANHLPLLLILLLTRSRLRLPENPNHGLHFLYFMGLAPVLLLSLAAFVFNIGVRDMWGMPMWNLSGLLVAAMLPVPTFVRQYPRLLAALAVWLAFVTALLAIFAVWGGQIRNKPSRIHWPQTALAQQAYTQWRQLSTCRLDTVGGSPWLAALAATAVSDRPSVMIAGEPAYSPWITAERLNKHGVLIVWYADETFPDLPLLHTAADLSDTAISEGEWQIAWHKLPERAPLHLKWRAYIPTDCRKTQP